MQVVAYSSIHGNTKYVAEHFASILKGQGEENVAVFDLARADMAQAVADSFRYDADISEHYHLRCLKCGAVDDALMDDGVKLQLTQDVEKQSGYTISRRQFYFFGLCPKCSTMH